MQILLISTDILQTRVRHQIIIIVYFLAKEQLQQITTSIQIQINLKRSRWVCRW